MGSMWFAEVQCGSQGFFEVQCGLLNVKILGG